MIIRAGGSLAQVDSDEEITNSTALEAVRAFLSEGKLLENIMPYPSGDPLRLGDGTPSFAGVAALASLVEGEVCSARTREHRFYRQQGPSQQVLAVSLLGIERFGRDKIEWRPKLLRVKTLRHHRFQGSQSLYFAVATGRENNFIFQPHIKDKYGALQQQWGVFEGEGLVDYLLYHLDLLWFQPEIREG